MYTSKDEVEGIFQDGWRTAESFKTLDDETKSLLQAEENWELGQLINDEDIN